MIYVNVKAIIPCTKYTVNPTLNFMKGHTVMTPKLNPKRSLKVTTIHSESAFRVGESSETYQRRKHAEFAEKQTQTLDKRNATLSHIADKNNRLKVTLIVCGLISLIAALFGTNVLVNNLLHFAYFKHVSFWISVSISVMFGGIMNRFLTYAEVEKQARLEHSAKIIKYK